MIEILIVFALADLKTLLREVFDEASSWFNMLPLLLRVSYKVDLLSYILTYMLLAGTIIILEYRLC